MKHLFIIAIFLTSAVSIQAQKLSTPQPSPHQTIIQSFGAGTIELSYSRPGLKGRELGGEFVPYKQLWRTGANAATVITFSHDVTIGDRLIPAGKYGLLSIPDKKEWIIIITKDLDVNSPVKYKEENDVVRVKVLVRRLSEKVETFTMNFSEFTASTCLLELSWENTLVSLPIATNTDEVVMKQIDGIFGKDNKPYYAAAQYYYENGKDLNQAKEWIDIVSADPKSQHMNHIWWLRARIYKKLGDKEEAKAAAQQTIKAAQHNKNPDYERWATELMESL